MTLVEATLPLLVTFGGFLALSPWLSPDSARVRVFWRWFALLILARYLLWRVFASLPEPEASPRYVYQVVCLSVEALFWYLVVGIRRRETRSKDRRVEVSHNDDWWKREPRPPLIDLLIPTYNEAKPILERTLVGARAQSYPHYRIWLLDDGARDWLRDWADELGVGYLRRSDNSHYKAGNMNAGLARIAREVGAADFVAVIDADFVLKPEFLTRTLALMHDESTAVVQTPQHFFNPDPFQHALGGMAALPDEQRYFFDYRLPIMDYSGYANCCGTSFLVRSSALESIGGFPTESVSEDTLMSMKLRKRGLRTVYLNEALSSGLNPDGLHQYLTQRARWALGLVQIMQSAWGPLARGKRLGQRIEYWLESSTWAFFCAYHWFAALVAIVFWLTGVYTIQAELTDIMYWGGPLWVESYIMCWLTRGRYMPMATEAAEAVTGFAVMPATLNALRKRGEKRFVVTAKGVQRDRVVFHWSILRWVLLAGGLQLAGILLAVLNPRSEMRANELFGFMLFNGVQTLIMFTVAALVCIELPNRREDDRFKTTERASLALDGERLSIGLVDISTQGVALAAGDWRLSVGRRLSIDIDGVGEVPAAVVRGAGLGARGLKLELSAEHRALMIRKLYCSDAYVRAPRAFSPWLFLGALARRIMA